MGKIIKAILILFLGLMAGFYFFYQLSLLPVDSKNQQFKTFTIPQGQPTKIIALRLKTEGLIKNQLVFRLFATKKNLSRQLQAGDFNLSPAMGMATIIESLTHGSKDYWITFPEGLRTEEYAVRLAEKSSIKPTDFIVLAKPFEGQLFPDTYLIPQSATAEDVVKLLTDTFMKKSPTQDKEKIIIASLIEREAKHSSDRSLVASVLYNRLKINMALQIDATVQYALGRTGNWWPKNLSRDDLKINSPYNTYLRVGLPPRPICNPGMSSLQAAAEPAETDNLYYVSDTAGNNHYARTLQEHNQNIAKYLTVDN